MRSAERYEILFDRAKGEYNETEVGAIRTKTIRAGDTLEVEAFPITRISDGAKREARERRSSPAQALLNHRNAQKKVCRLLEHNFGQCDYGLHLTIAYETYEHGHMSKTDYIDRLEGSGLPITDDMARKVIKNYFRRVRREMKKRGQDTKKLKYLYVIESSKPSVPDDPDPIQPRYHFHCAISAPGITRDELEKLWTLGYANCDRLDFKHNGLQAFAKYITKQRQVSRRWARSKNLIEPPQRISDRKISKRRAQMIAFDVAQFGREIFEKLYPGYRLCDDVYVRFSDFVAGAYIYARMRRKETANGSDGRYRERL